jgi:uncharacterized protein related to proFAR isomerase
VLEFDDNDVNCERDDEIVVFVRVGDVVDVVELDVGEVGTEEGVQIGVCVMVYWVNKVGLEEIDNSHQIKDINKIRISI